MSFKFALQNVMEYRKRLEEMAMRDMLLARKAYDDAKHVLEEFHDSIARSRLMAGQLHKEGGQAAENLRQIDSFVSGQIVRIQRQNLLLGELMLEVEKKQTILVQAAQDFIILEKGREKLKKRYMEKQKKLELKAIDDMVVMKFRPGGQGL